MRFLRPEGPEPSTAARDIASRSYGINISVSGVDSVLIERLTVTIERYLRIGAEYILIATNNAHSNQFDLACAICYPKTIKKHSLQKILRVRHIIICHILPCFGEPQDLGGRSWSMMALALLHGSWSMMALALLQDTMQQVCTCQSLTISVRARLYLALISCEN